jgi:hypothetical protein
MRKTRRPASVNRSVDQEGDELRDDEAACRQATLTEGELFKESPADFDPTKNGALKSPMSDESRSMYIIPTAFRGDIG